MTVAVVVVEQVEECTMHQGLRRDSTTFALRRCCGNVQEKFVRALELFDLTCSQYDRLDHGCRGYNAIHHLHRVSV